MCECRNKTCKFKQIIPSSIYTDVVLFPQSLTSIFALGKGMQREVFQEIKFWVLDFSIHLFLSDKPCVFGRIIVVQSRTLVSTLTVLSVIINGDIFPSKQLESIMEINTYVSVRRQFRDIQYNILVFYKQQSHLNLPLKEQLISGSFIFQLMSKTACTQAYLQMLRQPLTI